AESDSVLYEEPAEARAGYRKMRRSTFLQLWPLKYSAKQWTVVRLALNGTHIKDPPTKSGHDDAELAQHVTALRERVPRNFQILVEKPFVVIGDEPPDTVRRRSVATVRW